jgi:glucosamine--fructose-6-phosphate aminotransferase (isomerizing)
VTALAETVANQGAVLRHALELDLDSSAAKLAEAERVWLVGTGTSEHAALLGAAMLASAGRDACAVSGQGFVVAPPRFGPGDAAIVISHTASTTFARQAREEVLAAGARVVSITGEGKDWPEAIEAAPPERSETYTASYLAALLVLARLAAALGEREPSGDDRLRAASGIGRPAGLRTVSGAGDADGTSASGDGSRSASANGGPLAATALFDATDLAALPDLVEAAGAEPTLIERPPPRLTVLFGAGPAAVTAREGALKLREASRVLAEGFESEYLLHGSAVPLTEDDHLVAIDPDADPTGLTAEVAGAAEHEGIAVTRLTPPSDLPPLLAQLPLTARLQSLASDWADLRTVDPDTVITGAWAADSFWA